MKNTLLIIFLSILISHTAHAFTEFRIGGTVSSVSGPLDLETIGFAPGQTSTRFSFGVKFDPDEVDNSGGYTVIDASFKIGRIVGGAFGNFDRIRFSNSNSPDNFDRILLTVNFFSGFEYITPNQHLNVVEFRGLSFGISYPFDTFLDDPRLNVNPLNQPIHGSGSIGYTGFSTSPTDEINNFFGRVSLQNITILPEPSTWLMMVFGFAVTGLALKRRNHTQHMNA